MRDIRRRIGLVFQYPEYQLFGGEESLQRTLGRTIESGTAGR